MDEAYGLFDYSSVIISIWTYWIPFICILLNYKSNSKYYLPFYLFIFLITLYENVLIVFSDVLTDVYVYYHFYYLLESFLIIYQFKLWGLFKKINIKWYRFFLLLALVWLVDGLFVTKFSNRPDIYAPVYSLTVVFLSVKTINRINENFHNQIYQHPIFIICCSLLLFHTFSAIQSLFYIQIFRIIPEIQMLSLNILNSVTIACNLFYAISIFKIDKRKDKMQLL